jgi:hypothetical protein
MMIQHSVKKTLGWNWSNNTLWLIGLYPPPFSPILQHSMLHYPIILLYDISVYSPFSCITLEHKHFQWPFIQKSNVICQIIIIYKNDDFHYNLFFKKFNIFSIIWIHLR